MRGGPGLGNIAGAQGDYWQATRGGGHGDYRTFVMAPNSVNEMANFPRKCFEVSFKYRIPSMVLADGIIGQMMEPVEFEHPEIDPRTLPEPDWALGVARGRGKRIVKSYDLKEGGVEIMVNERVKRYDQIEASEVMYEEKMIEDAEVVIVAYGTSARIGAAAMKMAREKGLKVGLFRPITLWPFPKARITELSKRVKKFVAVEMSLGQMVEDVQLAINGRADVYLHAKPGASIITAEEVYKTLENIVKKGAKEYAAAK
jgi:2-oxoglutarate ferredoxin oxidoreductase subunit alpha